MPRETDLPAEDAVRAGKRNESGEIEGTREAGVYSEIKFSKIMENPLFFYKRIILYLSRYNHFTTKFNLLYFITNFISNYKTF